MDSSRAPLVDRLRALSGSLCGSLDAALRSALVHAGVDLGGGLRPVQLTSTLGLDKSLASRVVRALGTDDPIRALHGIPTPQGLGLIAAAVKERGAAEPEVARLEEATAAYGALLAEFSGGRTDLEATLTGYIPEQRERAERDARRSVFRGMTTLSGTRSSAIYNAVYLLPSAEPGRLDSLLVAVRQDLRRLRPGARLHLASIHADDGSRSRLPLGGGARIEDPRDLLIEELCSHPVPELQLEHTGARLMLAIGRDALDVNEMTTVGLGWRTPGHYPRGPEEGDFPSSITFTAHAPTEALVCDLFVHGDVALAGAPAGIVTANLDLYPAPARIRGDAVPADGSLQPVELTDLHRSPSGLHSAHVRSCPAIAENACREAGLDPGAFHAYRGSIAFPTPTEVLTLAWRVTAAGES